ncbi:MAG: hypothetical protein IPJ85_17270 [Flavobacteriales bacterium]|nr:hypothetical protein [Flavobacteriales bacterium]
MHRIATLVFLLTLATGQACAISVGADARPETCNNTNGYAWCSVSGGQPPYTYAWTGPNGFTASTDSIFGLDAGTYTITVTDNLGATANSNITVNDLASHCPSASAPTWAGAGAVIRLWGRRLRRPVQWRRRLRGPGSLAVPPFS